MTKTNDQYNSGPVDASVTQLIQPGRIGLLRRKHHKEITTDVTDGLWALLGSAVHHLLELGATDNQIVEERLFMNIDGWRMSGALDLQEVDGDFIDISDYKVTTSFSVRGDLKKDYENQLNLQAMLVEANKPGKTVRNMQIVAIIRDFSSAEAKRNPDYPQQPIIRLPVPLWSPEDRLQYARDRIAVHRQAQFDHDMGDDLEWCTAEDRWVRDEQWIVMKKGGKRALKRFDNPIEAEAFSDSKGTDYTVIYRPGSSLRCTYCGVSEWCNQYQTTIKDVEDHDRTSIPDEAAG